MATVGGTDEEGGLVAVVGLLFAWCLLNAILHPAEEHLKGLEKSQYEAGW